MGENERGREREREREMQGEKKRRVRAKFSWMRGLPNSLRRTHILSRELKVLSVGDFAPPVPSVVARVSEGTIVW